MSSEKIRKRRSSNEEMCQRHTKERGKLYYQKRKLIKQLDSGKLKGKSLEKVNSDITKLDGKLYKVKSKLFKCGKKYAKLKKARRSILNKISRIKSELKKNHDMPYKDRNKLLGEMKELSDTARDLSIAMGMDIVEQKSGNITFDFDEDTGESSESATVWEARDKVVNFIETGKFDKVIIDGDLYDVSMNKFGLLNALDDFISDIMSSQRNSSVKTPMLIITENYKNKLLEVKYLKYGA